MTRVVVSQNRLQDLRDALQEAAGALTRAMDALEGVEATTEDLESPEGYQGRLPAVCIDAGHGGHDPGALDASGTVREADVVLEYAHALETYLDALGCRTIMTRTGDQFAPLSQRVRQANEAPADVFVSLHANAADNVRAGGAWLIHDDKTPKVDGVALAEAVFQEMSAVPGIVDQDEDVEVFPDGSPWVGERNLAVVSRTTMPAILVELGFMTNEEDLTRLQDDATRDQVAVAIGRGVLVWWRQRQRS